VAIARRLHEDLKAAHYQVVLRHRDVNRER
jgi:hypothetical protein